ncbi:MAG TPA: PIN domain-containing protein [Solirubrobacteraceae bacterium]|nr:PIN domain-containing protein [Solirubrobacteraceae bacterium]
MSIELWDGEGAVLVDTSAWMFARRIPQARDLLFAAAERGDVAWCWPVRYELTFDAPSPERIAAVDRTLAGLREIAVNHAVQRGVLSTMRELADGGSHGAHRLPLADLTVAVAAQSSGLDVLHYDHHFERLGKLLGVRMLWIAEPDS